MKRLLHKVSCGVFNYIPRKKRLRRGNDTTPPSPDAPTSGGANISLLKRDNRPGPSTNEATPDVTQHWITPPATRPSEAGSPSEGSDPPIAVVSQEEPHPVAPTPESTPIVVSQEDNSVMVPAPLEIGFPTSNTGNPSVQAAPPPEEEVPPTTRKVGGPSFFEKVVDPVLYCLDITEKALDLAGIPLAKSIVGILSQTVKQVKDMQGNRKGFSELADELRNFSGKVSEGFLALQSSGEFDEELEKDINELLHPLISFCADIEDRRCHGTLEDYFRAGNDKDALAQLKEKVKTAKDNFQVGSHIRIERRLGDESRRRLVNDLPRAKAASWNSNRSNAPVSCFEGTREGVLREITEWIDSDDPASPRVFWLNGMAGIGKSTIARTIAERAYKRRILGGSFFFSRNDHDLSDIGLLFPTIAHQLAHHHVTYLSSIAGALEREGDLGHKDVSTQFTKLFLGPITGSTHKPTVLLLVLDALDEASPENDVRRLLELLLSVRVDFALKIFLTSRPEAHIRLIFDKDQYHSHFVLHDIEQSVVEGDIRRFLTHALSAIPKQLGISVTDWPSPSDLDAVVAKSGRLFIFATTVVRFIKGGRIPNPQGRLTRFLHSQTALGVSTYKQLDQLYLHVLQSAVNEDDDNGYVVCLRATLATIVLIRNPIPLAALAALIGHDPEQIQLSLYHLHSIILVPSTIQDTPKIYHLSFPDFITDSSRCKDEKFYVNIQSQETSLLLQCLGTMMKSLHFNMSGFDIGPYTVNEFDWRGRPVIKSMSNKDISYDTLLTLISPELGYACQFWCSHLLKIVNPTSEALEQLKDFSFEHLLFWVETMSLLGLVESARVAMRDAHQWASKSDCKKDLIDILYDSYRLIWLYQSQISTFAMNIYLVALPLMPQNTCLFITYKNKWNTTQRLYPKSLTWLPMLSSGIAPHQEGLWSVAYASDGQYFATGSNSGSIDLWDTLSGAHIRSFETMFPEAIWKICFTSDSQYLVSMSTFYEKVYLWSVITGTHISTFNNYPGRLTDISVISEQLATASQDKTVKIWDIKTTHCQSTFQHSEKVNSVWLDPKGDRLLSATKNKVLIWDSISGEQIGEISKPHLRKLIVSPCGKFLALAFKGILEIFENSQRLETCIKTVQSSRSHRARFSSCGNYIAFVQQNITVISQFQVYDKSEIRLQTDMAEVAFSPDSKQLVSVYIQACSLWDIHTATSQTVNQFSSQDLAEVSCIAVSDNQALFAVVSKNKNIKIWNSQTKDIEMNFKTEISDYWIYVAFSSDSLLLAAGSNQARILIFDLQTQERNTTTQYSEEQVTQIALSMKGQCTALVFSSDNLYLVAGNDNGKVWIFDIKTRDQVFYFDTQTLFQIERVIFSDNDQKLIVATSTEKYQYDIKLISQPILISTEYNNNLFAQDWRVQNITITEQNLVLFQLLNGRYSPLFQITDFIDNDYLKVFRVENIVLLSFSDTGYIFE